VGRSLFLLGKHKAALDYLEEALRMGHQDDWEIWHNKVRVCVCAYVCVYVHMCTRVCMCVCVCERESVCMLNARVYMLRRHRRDGVE